jgi:hypothetical protein
VLRVPAGPKQRMTAVKDKQKIKKEKSSISPSPESKESKLEREIAPCYSDYVTGSGWKNISWHKLPLFTNVMSKNPET